MGRPCVFSRSERITREFWKKKEKESVAVEGS